MTAPSPDFLGPTVAQHVERDQWTETRAWINAARDTRDWERWCDTFNEPWRALQRAHSGRVLTGALNGASWRVTP